MRIVPECVGGCGYIFATGSMGLSSFKFSWWAPQDARIPIRVLKGRSRSSDVVDFGTNRKCIQLLLVMNG